MTSCIFLVVFLDLSWPVCMLWHSYTSATEAQVAVPAAAVGNTIAFCTWRLKIKSPLSDSFSCFKYLLLLCFYCATVRHCVCQMLPALGAWKNDIALGNYGEIKKEKCLCWLGGLACHLSVSLGAGFACENSLQTNASLMKNRRCLWLRPFLLKDYWSFFALYISSMVLRL